MTRLIRSIASALALASAAVPLAACGSASAPVAHAARWPTPVVGHVDKLVVLVVENHSLAQMRDGMPWVNRLARRYGYTTRYDALTHPSLPNYLAIAGGTTYGVTDDAAPAAHPLRGPSVFGRATASGSTARVYAESMPARCYTAPAGRYAVKHNPWAYFVDERRACRAGDVPLARLGRDVDTGSLPAVGMVIPDICNDAHDCSLATANAWMRTQVGHLLHGPDWRSGRLAIVVTADEDDGAHSNRILTVVAHPALDHAVVSTPMTHYALSRSYAEVGGFAPLGHARRAPSLLRQFGLAAASGRR